MLIDALRADFVFKSSRPKIEYLTRKCDGENDAFCMVTRVMPPTVTLPRIKALTTGGIPGFVDFVMNFGSAELKEDNLIAQWKSNKREIVHYGDETWLKLFPGKFSRFEGTTSFFVSDYTEVDDNVTRHIDNELIRDDWDVPYTSLSRSRSHRTSDRAE